MVQDTETVQRSFFSLRGPPPPPPAPPPCTRLATWEPIGPAPCTRKRDNPKGVHELRRSRILKVSKESSGSLKRGQPPGLKRGDRTNPGQPVKGGLKQPSKVHTAGSRIFKSDKGRPANAVGMMKKPDPGARVPPGLKVLGPPKFSVRLHPTHRVDPGRADEGWIAAGTKFPDLALPFKLAALSPGHKRRYRANSVSPNGQAEQSRTDPQQKQLQGSEQEDDFHDLCGYVQPPMGGEPMSSLASRDAVGVRRSSVSGPEEALHHLPIADVQAGACPGTVSKADWNRLLFGQSDSESGDSQVVVGQSLQGALNDTACFQKSVPLPMSPGPCNSPAQAALGGAADGAVAPVKFGQHQSSCASPAWNPPNGPWNPALVAPSLMWLATASPGQLDKVLGRETSLDNSLKLVGGRAGTTPWLECKTPQKPLGQKPGGRDLVAGALETGHLVKHTKLGELHPGSPHQDQDCDLLSPESDSTQEEQQPGHHDDTHHLNHVPPVMVPLPRLGGSRTLGERWFLKRLEAHPEEQVAGQFQSRVISPDDCVLQGDPLLELGPTRDPEAADVHGGNISPAAGGRWPAERSPPAVCPAPLHQETKQPWASSPSLVALLGQATLADPLQPRPPPANTSLTAPTTPCYMKLMVDHQGLLSPADIRTPVASLTPPCPPPPSLLSPLKVHNHHLEDYLDLIQVNEDMWADTQATFQSAFDYFASRYTSPLPYKSPRTSVHRPKRGICQSPEKSAPPLTAPQQGFISAPLSPEGGELQRAKGAEPPSGRSLGRRCNKEETRLQDKEIHHSPHNVPAPGSRNGVLPRQGVSCTPAPLESVIGATYQGGATNQGGASSFGFSGLSMSAPDHAAIPEGITCGPGGSTSNSSCSPSAVPPGQGMSANLTYQCSAEDPLRFDSPTKKGAKGPNADQCKGDSARKPPSSPVMVTDIDTELFPMINNGHKDTDINEIRDAVGDVAIREKRLASVPWGLPGQVLDIPSSGTSIVTMCDVRGSFFDWQPVHLTCADQLPVSSLDLPPDWMGDIEAPPNGRVPPGMALERDKQQVVASVTELQEDRGTGHRDPAQPTGPLRGDASELPHEAGQLEQLEDGIKPGVPAAVRCRVESPDGSGAITLGLGLDSPSVELTYSGGCALSRLEPLPQSNNMSVVAPGWGEMALPPDEDSPSISFAPTFPPPDVSLGTPPRLPFKLIDSLDLADKITTVKKRFAALCGGGLPATGSILQEMPIGQPVPWNVLPSPCSREARTETTSIEEPQWRPQQVSPIVAPEHETTCTEGQEEHKVANTDTEPLLEAILVASPTPSSCLSSPSDDYPGRLMSEDTGHNEGVGASLSTLLEGAASPRVTPDGEGLSPISIMLGLSDNPLCDLPDTPSSAGASMGTPLSGFSLYRNNLYEQGSCGPRVSSERGRTEDSASLRLSPPAGSPQGWSPVLSTEVGGTPWLSIARKAAVGPPMGALDHHPVSLLAQGSNEMPPLGGLLLEVEPSCEARLEGPLLQYTPVPGSWDVTSRPQPPTLVAPSSCGSCKTPQNSTIGMRGSQAPKSSIQESAVQDFLNGGGHRHAVSPVAFPPLDPCQGDIVKSLAVDLVAQQGSEAGGLESEGTAAGIPSGPGLGPGRAIDTGATEESSRSKDKEGRRRLSVSDIRPALRDHGHDGRSDDNGANDSAPRDNTQSSLEDCLVPHHGLFSFPTHDHQAQHYDQRLHLWRMTDPKVSAPRPSCLNSGSRLWTSQELYSLERSEACGSDRADENTGAAEPLISLQEACLVASKIDVGTGGGAPGEHSLSELDITMNVSPGRDGDVSEELLAASGDPTTSAPINSEGRGVRVAFHACPSDRAPDKYAIKTASVEHERWAQGNEGRGMSPPCLEKGSGSAGAAPGSALQGPPHLARTSAASNTARKAQSSPSANTVHGPITEAAASEGEAVVDWYIPEGMDVEELLTAVEELVQRRTARSRQLEECEDKSGMGEKTPTPQPLPHPEAEMESVIIPNDATAVPCCNPAAPPPPPPLPAVLPPLAPPLPPPLPPPSSKVPPPPCLAPPPTKGLTRVTPTKHQQLRLKQLHWDKIQRAGEHTVWEALRSRAKSPTFNRSELETLFRVLDNTPHQKPTAAHSKQWVQLVDSGRAQLVAIRLAGVHLSHQQIYDALRSMDPSALNQDQLQALSKAVPTQQEVQDIQLYLAGKHPRYPGDSHPGRLGVVEQFFQTVHRLPRMSQRIQLLLCMANFPQQSSTLRTQLDMLQGAANDLMTCQDFQMLLEGVLAVGNHLNTGTHRGRAAGFRLDTLLKLADVKGSDKKTSLLQFVVREVLARCPTITELPRQLQKVQQAAKIQVDSLSGIMCELETNLLLVDEEIQMLREEDTNWGSASPQCEDLADGTCSHDALKEFATQSRVVVEELAGKLAVCMDELRELSNFFGEPQAAREPTHILTVVASFLPMLAKALAELPSMNHSSALR